MAGRFRVALLLLPVPFALVRLPVTLAAPLVFLCLVVCSCSLLISVLGCSCRFRFLVGVIPGFASFCVVLILGNVGVLGVSVNSYGVGGAAAASSMLLFLVSLLAASLCRRAVVALAPLSSSRDVVFHLPCCAPLLVLACCSGWLALDDSFSIGCGPLPFVFERDGLPGHTYRYVYAQLVSQSCPCAGMWSTLPAATGVARLVQPWVGQSPA